MSITDGHQAMINRLVTMTGAPNIVLPNGPGAGLPRYVVQVAGGMQRTATINGTTETNPEIVVMVETGAKDSAGKDAYATANDTLVKALVDRFPVNTRFSGVTIINAPEVKPAMPVTEGVYSVPVIIRGRFYF